MEKLRLLSTEAQKLGFENLKSTFEKILDSDLELDEDLSNQIEHIKKNLDIIVSKKGRLDTKINKNFSEINCEGVDSVLDLSEKLLKNLYGNHDLQYIKDDYELAKMEIEEIKKAIKEQKKTLKDLAESIKNKKSYERKIEQIELLEVVIKEIKNFRIELLKILKNKQEDQTDIEGKKDNVREKQESTKNFEFSLDYITRLYKQNNFIGEVKVFWNKLNQEQKLDICDFLVGKKEKGMLNTLFRVAEYKEADLSDEYKNKFTGIIEFISGVVNSEKIEDAEVLINHNGKEEVQITTIKPISREKEQGKLNDIFKKTLEEHLQKEFKFKEFFSFFLNEYFEKNQNNWIFIIELLAIIKDFSESYMKLFVDQLSKLNLSKQFYNKFVYLLNKEENFEFEEARIILLNGLKENQNNAIISEEISEVIYGDVALDNKIIEDILSKKKKSFYDYLFLFDFAEDSEKIREIFDKINKTFIHKNLDISNEEKLEFFLKYRQFFMKNFKGSRRDFNSIKTLDRNIKKYYEEYTITTEEKIGLKKKKEKIKREKKEITKKDWRIRKRFGIDEKIKILEEIDNVEDLKLFYDKLSKGFLLFVYNSRKDGKKEIAKDFFEKFIEKFEILGEEEYVKNFVSNLSDNLITLIGERKKDKKKKNEKSSDGTSEKTSERLKEGKSNGGLTEEQLDNIYKYIQSLEEEVQELKQENTELKNKLKQNQKQVKRGRPRKKSQSHNSSITELERAFLNGKRQEPLSPEEAEEVKSRIFSGNGENQQNKESYDEKSLEEKQKIILQNLEIKGKRQSDKKLWYDIGIDRIIELGEVDSDFVNKLISKLKPRDITFFYNNGSDNNKEKIFPQSNELKVLIYKRFASEGVILFDEELEFFEELTQFMIDNITVGKPKKGELIRKYKNVLKSKQ